MKVMVGVSFGNCGVGRMVVVSLMSLFAGPGTEPLRRTYAFLMLPYLRNPPFALIFRSTRMRNILFEKLFVPFTPMSID